MFIFKKTGHTIKPLPLKVIMSLKKNIINGIIIFMYLALLCTVGCAIDRFHAFAKTLLRYFRNYHGLLIVSTDDLTSNYCSIGSHDILKININLRSFLWFLV